MASQAIALAGEVVNGALDWATASSGRFPGLGRTVQDVVANTLDEVGALTKAGKSLPTDELFRPAGKVIQDGGRIIGGSGDYDGSSAAGGKMFVGSTGAASDEQMRQNLLEAEQRLVRWESPLHKGDLFASKKLNIPFEQRQFKQPNADSGIDLLSLLSGRRADDATGNSLTVGSEPNSDYDTENRGTLVSGGSTKSEADVVYQRQQFEAQQRWLAGGSGNDSYAGSDSYHDGSIMPAASRTIASEEASDSNDMINSLYRGKGHRAFVSEEDVLSKPRNAPVSKGTGEAPIGSADAKVLVSPISPNVKLADSNEKLSILDDPTDGEKSRRLRPGEVPYPGLSPELIPELKARQRAAREFVAGIVGIPSKRAVAAGPAETTQPATSAESATTTDTSSDLVESEKSTQQADSLSERGKEAEGIRTGQSNPLYYPIDAQPSYGSWFPARDKRGRKIPGKWEFVQGLQIPEKVRRYVPVRGAQQLPMDDDDRGIPMSQAAGANNKSSSESETQTSPKGDENSLSGGSDTHSSESSATESSATGAGGDHSGTGAGVNRTTKPDFEDPATVVREAAIKAARSEFAEKARLALVNGVPSTYQPQPAWLLQPIRKHREQLGADSWGKMLPQAAENPKRLNDQNAQTADSSPTVSEKLPTEVDFTSQLIQSGGQLEESSEEAALVAAGSIGTRRSIGASSELSPESMRPNNDAGQRLQQGTAAFMQGTGAGPDDDDDGDFLRAHMKVISFLDVGSSQEGGAHSHYHSGSTENYLQKLEFHPNLLRRGKTAFLGGFSSNELSDDINQPAGTRKALRKCHDDALRNGCSFHNKSFSASSVLAGSTRGSSVNVGARTCFADEGADKAAAAEAAPAEAAPAEAAPAEGAPAEGAAPPKAAAEDGAAAKGGEEAGGDEGAAPPEAAAPGGDEAEGEDEAQNVDAAKKAEQELPEHQRRLFKKMRKIASQWLSQWKEFSRAEDELGGHIKAIVQKLEQKPGIDVQIAESR